MRVLSHAAAALQGSCQTSLLQAAAAAVGFRRHQTACTITASTCLIPWICNQACRPSQHALTHTLPAMTRTSCRLPSAKGAYVGRIKEHPAISSPHPLTLLACKCKLCPHLKFNRQQLPNGLPQLLHILYPKMCCVWVLRNPWTGRPELPGKSFITDAHQVALHNWAS